ILDVPSIRKLPLPFRRIPLPTPGVSAAGDVAFVDAAPDDIVFVQFSSGSTTTPKGIPILPRNLVWNLRAITDNDRRGPNKPGSIWLPLYHDMGLIGLLSSIYASSDCHLAVPTSFLMKPLVWLRHISARKVSVLPIPNFAIDYVLRMLRDA